jgi:hypothetical protein
MEWYLVKHRDNLTFKGTAQLYSTMSLNFALFQFGLDDRIRFPAGVITGCFSLSCLRVQTGSGAHPNPTGTGDSFHGIKAAGA